MDRPKSLSLMAMPIRSILFFCRTTCNNTHDKSISIANNEFKWNSAIFYFMLSFMYSPKTSISRQSYRKQWKRVKQWVHTSASFLALVGSAGAGLTASASVALACQQQDHRDTPYQRIFSSLHISRKSILKLSTFHVPARLDRQHPVRHRPGQCRLPPSVFWKWRTQEEHWEVPWVVSLAVWRCGLSFLSLYWSKNMREISCSVLQLSICEMTRHLTLSSWRRAHTERSRCRHLLEVIDMVEMLLHVGAQHQFDNVLT